LKDQTTTKEKPMSEPKTALARRDPALPPTVHLVATRPEEMATAAAELKTFLVGKIDALEIDIRDLNASIGEGRKANWRVQNLERLRNQAVDHQEFFAKVLAAAEAGYTIVPDFPIDIFAIRVTEGRVPEKPPQKASWTTRPRPDAEDPNVLAAGEGEYVSPIPRVFYQTETRTKPIAGTDRTEQITVHVARPIDLRKVVFPLRAARPEVMEATREAMAQRIFDEIGICPPQPKADPLIIGRILTSSHSQTIKTVSFLIVWYLNLREL
jgi:hypothetical protein